MTTDMHIKARITPWDDTAFVKAFEAARGEVRNAGVTECVQAGARVQHLLREAGYPNSRVEVDCTVEESLENVSHWLVNRDG